MYFFDSLEVKSLCRRVGLSTFESAPKAPQKRSKSVKMHQESKFCSWITYFHLTCQDNFQFFQHFRKWNNKHKVGTLSTISYRYYVLLKTHNYKVKQAKIRKWKSKILTSGPLEKMKSIYTQINTSLLKVSVTN